MSHATDHVFESINQRLIERIGEFLDDEYTQYEQAVGLIKDPVPREKSELHIRMANAAFEEYKKTMNEHPLTLLKEGETGIELIAKERFEQINKHGRTVELDAEQNDLCELIDGAVCLLENEHAGSFPVKWDDNICRNMAGKGYIERLTIAGALIAAEIDRIKYEQSKTPTKILKP